MKKLLFVCMMGISLLIGCNNYKNFQEAVTALNKKYQSVAEHIFTQKKESWEESSQREQQKYDRQFQKLAKKWEENTENNEYHISIYKQVQQLHINLCTEKVYTPYQEEIEERLAIYIPWAVSIPRSYYGGQMARQLGAEVGVDQLALQKKYEKVASKYGCVIPEEFKTALSNGVSNVFAFF